MAKRRASSTRRIVRLRGRHGTYVRGGNAKDLRKKGWHSTPHSNGDLRLFRGRVAERHIAIRTDGGGLAGNVVLSCGSHGLLGRQGFLEAARIASARCTPCGYKGLGTGQSRRIRRPLRLCARQIEIRQVDGEGAK